VLIVLGAAAAWGFGSVLGHRLALPSQAMLAAAIEMLAGGAVLLAVAAGTGEFGRIQWASVPASSWLALAYLVGPGSILAFTAYGYALSRLPVATVSTYAYVNPVVAVLAGIVILGERFTWREGLGAVLVVASVAVILYPPRAGGGSARARRAAQDGEHLGGRGRGRLRLPGVHRYQRRSQFQRGDGRRELACALQHPRQADDITVDGVTADTVPAARAADR
jgi:uncharacterized membrane protein